MGAEAEARSYTRIGRGLMKEGQYRNAAAQFKHAIDIKPDYAEPYMSLGILFHLTGDNNKALEYLNKSIDLNPEKKEIIYNNLGLIYESQGDFEKALNMYRQAVKMDIRTAKVWRNIGLIEMKLENYKGVIEAYSKVIENRPTLYNQYMNMLKEELEADNIGDYKDEIEAQLDRGISTNDLVLYDNVVVELLLKHNRQLADDYTNLALSLENNGQLDSAIIHFRNAAAINSKSTSILNRIGVLCAKLGNFEEAEEAFKATLKVDPGNKGARLGLERLWMGDE